MNEEHTSIAPSAEQAENERDARAEELQSTFSYDGYQVVRKELFAHAHWNMKRSYRLAGKSFLEQNLVSFPISDAIPIENGKMLDEAVSPTVAHVGQKPAHRKTIPVRQ